ncbi:MAG: alpha/beta hydrolase [Dehalococcoidales bacterium]|nr:alpha/beta hydrolase [Dehalococcoidales bacterium]
MSRDLTEFLDAELREPIRKMMAMMPPSNFDDLEATRAASKQQTAAMKKVTPDLPEIVYENRTIPGPEGAPDIPVRIYRPRNQTKPLPGFLWIHGGGYIVGDIDSIDMMAQQLTLAGDCVTVSVDYRLAPEHPFPAPLEDCYAALKWLNGNAEKLKVDASRIAVGGGSAGGGLAAGLSLLARDRGEVTIIFQLLIYPMIDDRSTEPASDTLRDALFWTRKLNMLGWRSYLGKIPGRGKTKHYAAPARSNNLKGLPKTYICVGDQDLFAEEDTVFASRLVAAGVSTELHLYPGGCHAFDSLVPDADVSKRFTADIHRALRRALHG